MKVVATYSIKGGVGKTSTAVNLAFEAARAGSRVLVWDLDPQGAATYLFRVRPKVRGGSRRLVGADGELAGHIRGSDLSPVHVVPADFSLRHLDLHLEGTKRPTERLAALLDPLRDHYDLALLDCPPSISLASESVFGAADTLLVPVVPATLASRTLTQLVDFLDDQVRAPKVAPLLSMVDRRRKLHRELVESLSAEWPELFATAVPSAAVDRAHGHRARPGRRVRAVVARDARLPRALGRGRPGPLAVTTARSVDEVLQLLQGHGEELYDEEIFQLAHAEQTAALARAAGAADSLVAASLLHDVGHLLELVERQGTRDRTTDQRHEARGSAWLAGIFPSSVTAPIALHVRAKRYLCAVDPTYHDVLSPGSVASLERQGGPFDAGEVAAFEANAGWEDAVALRRWDDLAKVPDLEVPKAADHRPLLESLTTSRGQSRSLWS